MSKASPGSLTAHLTDFFLSPKVLGALARRFGAGRGRRKVDRFNDFMLRDIGLTRADLLSSAHGKVQRRD